MKYDVKLQFASLNGINLTNFGDVFCEHTRDGDAIEKVKGIQGDPVTLARYDQFDTFRITQNVFSPIKGQVDNWEKYHTPLTFQYKDNNTGVTKSSTSAYIQSHTESVDGQQWEVIIYCEEVK
jgi:hypothetical protein